MTYENYIKAQLVRLVVDEGWDGSVDTPLAIAQVFKNRVEAGWCGGDWMKVIATAQDFIGTIRQRPEVEPRDLTFRRVLQGVDDIYYGIADDSMVNDDQGQTSLYYAELHNLNRQWFKDNILSDPESHPMIAKVGQINFFA